MAVPNCKGLGHGEKWSLGGVGTAAGRASISWTACHSAMPREGGYRVWSKDTESRIWELLKPHRGSEGE